MLIFMDLIIIRLKHKAVFTGLINVLIKVHKTMRFFVNWENLPIFTFELSTKFQKMKD